MKKILVTGVAGSGKSSVNSELKKRGYKTCDIEEVDGLFAMVDKKTGKIVDSHDNDDLEIVKKHNWVCDKVKLQRLLNHESGDIVFYCGTASNIDEIIPFFDKVILLKASPETILQRLSKRKVKDFGNIAEVREWVLSWKDWWENEVQEKGVITINANKSLKKVVIDIIKRSKA